MRYQLATRQPEMTSGRYYIAPSADVIGSVILHSDVSIWFHAVLRGDNESITIGARSNIQDGCVLHTDPGAPISVGEGVTVGHRAVLHGCQIGDNSLVGINAVVLNHARIGKNCIIGANALVTEGMDIPDGSLVVGTPAKILKSVTDVQIQSLQESAQVYIGKMYDYCENLEPVDAV